MLENGYLEDYASICGWQATLVYTSLVYYSFNKDTCYPSIKTIANLQGISRNTVQKGITVLKFFNIIKVTKKKSTRNKGKWSNNIYFINDKSDWQPVDKSVDNLNIPVDKLQKAVDKLSTKLGYRTLTEARAVPSQRH